MARKPHWWVWRKAYDELVNDSGAGKFDEEFREKVDEEIEAMGRKTW